MSALTPKDRRLLGRINQAQQGDEYPPMTDDLTAVLKLVNRLARRIDGPKPKNQSARNRRVAQDMQRDVANTLKPVYAEARNNPQYRGAKREGCDVEGTPFWIEAKNRKDGSVFTAYRQAMADKAKAEDTRPVLIATTRNREPVLVAMHISTFVQLLEGFGVGDVGAMPELEEVQQ